ncbi:MAG: ABC transporter ATP-binding protein [Candidatus Magnetobacterium sp. LHC-1]|uniref:ABC transporter ATP-binding protein n=1 Tax=Candidatus Magnetobacterium casense TaxID=1455061 RepID=A0ABS6RY98_9BACT|nr:ABC transporter ATP-binding protein [Candidatus Magnetobacterium casensis]MBF0608541.1 ABC transporter ATP-binding protein [Nitrospirota bacterium]MBV6341615.1 ABC transporter ATP-binding protein [Candidatus Magnetobacterium casensis]
MVTVEGISKVYNAGMPDEMLALSDVSLETGSAEMVVLKGPSGSGKTTLLGIIGCMIRPTQGKVLINGRDVVKLPERFLTQIRRKTFGFIFQHFNLIPGISVRENVCLPLYPTTVPLTVMKERLHRILTDLDIRHKINTEVTRLSGGERQRVAIARALINDPEMLLADEPTAHLDSKLSEDLIDILRRLCQQGKTIIIASHDAIVYDNPFVSRIIEMRHGKVTGPGNNS